ncbi:hypothetical protein M758_12G026500 [Ceratodon purpureus]|nr:hypothetical protein M758_12G026500 [Ceratodon purpureus]
MPVWRSWVQLLMLATAILIHPVDGALPKKSVRILNELPGTLTVRCQSKDADLQTQKLEAGRDYVFSFYLDTWGTTNYWCAFHFGKQWNASFDVFIGHGMETVPCVHCLWVVKTEGFLLAEEGQVPIIQKPWQQTD